MVVCVLLLLALLFGVAPWGERWNGEEERTGNRNAPAKPADSASSGSVAESIWPRLRVHQSEAARQREETGFASGSSTDQLRIFALFSLDQFDWFAGPAIASDCFVSSHLWCGSDELQSVPVCCALFGVAVCWRIGFFFDF